MIVLWSTIQAIGLSSIVTAQPPGHLLFDGQSFAGWEGDTKNTWRIEKGTITAGSHDRKAPRNEFLSTRTEYENFELRLKFKIEGNINVNAGVQFRTKRIPNHHEVSGYQADIGPTVDGHLYDESRRRRMLAKPDKATLQKAQAAAPEDGWQTYRIRAEGRRIRLWLNGVRTVDYQESEEAIPLNGVIALQIHGGMQATISYKEITIEEFSDTPKPQSGRLSPAAALDSLVVAEGLQVKTFASDPTIVSITNIDVDHRGRVWACECVNYRNNNNKRPDGDRILILEDLDGDGICDETTVFYQGRDVDIAMGLCVLGNKAIVSCSPNILLLEDTDGDDRADKKTVLLTSDAVFQHDHSLHSLVFGPDGRFYGNFGNTGHRLKDVDGQTIVDQRGREIVANGKPFHGGMVFRCDRNFQNFEILGHNFRNNYEAAVDSFGRIWQSDNDDDGNLGVRLNYIMEGGNYGYLDELTSERWTKPRIGQHDQRNKRHWHQNDPGTVPNVIETGNGAPTGVTVYEGSLLPDAFVNQVLFCDAGPHLVWGLPVTANGSGFSASKTELLSSSDNSFRPVDASVAPDGSVFISDWYDPVVGGFKQDDIERGRIYWIGPKDAEYKPTAHHAQTVQNAIDALCSPNACARYLAWNKLHSMGSEAEAPLVELLEQSNPRLRARAYWLLGQIPNKEAKYIERAANDQDENVRVVGLRLAEILASVKDSETDLLAVCARMANDKSSRVRAETAVALRRFDSALAAKTWARIATMHEAGDRWGLEALGIGADGKWDNCLAAYDEVAQSRSESQRRDLIWRSRGTNSASKLAHIIRTADETIHVDRYLRALEFQPTESRDKAFLEIALDDSVRPSIAAESLSRITPKRLRDTTELPRLIQRIKSEPINALILNLVKQLEITDLYPQLLATAMQPESDVRVDAITALLDLKQHELIVSAIAGKNREAAVAIATTVAQSQHIDSAQMIFSFLKNDDLSAESRKQVARSFAGSDFGADKMLTWIEHKEIDDPGMQMSVASTILLNPNKQLAQRAEKLFPLAPTKDTSRLPTLSNLLKMKGDEKVGKRVFFNEGKCSQCHKIDGVGNAVGPDIGQIGTKLARPAMFESVLYPSAAISHNFEAYAALMNDGRVFTGLLVNQNDQELQLRDQQNVLRTLKLEDVSEFQQLSVSLMPEGLHWAMSAQELVDLVEYMLTLR